MATANNNIVLHETSGHIGKQIVIKQYAYGTVVTKYPDMSNIKPSKKQKQKRNKFKEAVAYSKAIINDPVKKKAYSKKVKKGQTVYHFALQEYLNNHKND